MTISRRRFALSSLAFLAASSRNARSQSSKVRVLIIDGVNNHDWMAATHAVAEILATTTVFSVDVSTTPPRGAAPEAWNSWHPDFSRYDVVINNFNGGEKADGIEWPIGVQQSLEKFVRTWGRPCRLSCGQQRFSQLEGIQRHDRPGVAHEIIWTRPGGIR